MTLARRQPIQVPLVSSGLFRRERRSGLRTRLFALLTEGAVMLRILLSFIALSVASGTIPCAAAPNNVINRAIIARISSEMQAFSAGERALFVSTYVTHPTIVDDAAPFVWTDAAKWYDANRPTLRDVTLTPGIPTEIQIEKGRAFASVPFTIAGHGSKGGAFKANGYWTGVLVYANGTWRIADVAITVTQ